MKGVGWRDGERERENMTEKERGIGKERDEAEEIERKED